MPEPAYAMIAGCVAGLRLKKPTAKSRRDGVQTFIVYISITYPDPGVC
jgi:hypothetical protein